MSIKLAEFDLPLYIEMWERRLQLVLAYTRAAGHPPQPHYLTHPDTAYLVRKRGPQ